jgi:hypothetical protein
MCNQKVNGENLRNHVGEHGINNIVYQAQAIGIPMANVRQGVCPRCGYQLSYKEMFESSLTPRFLCEPCYNQAISRVRNTCLLTGEPLSAQQIQNQRNCPRELQYRIAEGLPWDATTVMANIVLGNFYNPFHTTIPNSGYTNQRYYESQYINDGVRPMALPVPRGSRINDQSFRMIDYQPVDSINSFFQNSRRQEEAFINLNNRGSWWE